MKKNIMALLCGLMFGAGLNVSQMTNPQKVLNFLDLSGRWDPSLILVMFAALVVSALGFLLSRKLKNPLFSEQFSLPSLTMVTTRLLIGAVLFGLGWGLVGLCPGPAIVSLAHPSEEVLVFLAAMFVGMLLGRKIKTTWGILGEHT